MTPERDVRDVLRQLAAHPVDLLLRRWNWKTAVLTAVLRGAIFFTTNVPAGLGAAVEVLGRDLLFRVPLGGFYGAISQAFSGAGPPRTVYVIVAVIVPAIAHVAEFLVHWLGGTPRLGAAIATSIVFSALSAVFNLFLMRRGVLLVGASARTLREDVVRLPRLLFEFVIWIPSSVCRVRRNRAWRPGNGPPRSGVAKPG